MKNKKSLIKRLIQRLAPCLLGALLMPGTAQAVNYLNPYCLQPFFRLKSPRGQSPAFFRA